MKFTLRLFKSSLAFAYIVKFYSLYINLITIVVMSHCTILTQSRQTFTSRMFVTKGVVMYLKFFVEILIRNRKKIVTQKFLSLPEKSNTRS